MKKKIRKILWIAQTKINPNFLNTFTEKGIRIDVLTPSIEEMNRMLSYSKIKNAQLIRLVRMPAAPLLPFSVPRYLRKNRTEDYDVIMTESPVFGGLAGVFAKRRLGKPLIVKIGIFFEEYFLHSAGIFSRLLLPLWKSIIRFVYKNSNLIIADNALIEQDIRQYSGSSKIELCIPYGIDTDFFRPPKSLKEKSSIRARLGLPENKIIGIFIGRFTKEKGGVEPLIRSIASINQSSSDFHLVLVGRGYLQEKYQSLIRRLGLENVEIRDQMSHNDVALMMRAGDIYLQPSFAEGHGIAPLEAMASGLFVVATHVGGLKLTVKEGVTGFVVNDPYNPDSYTTALMKAIGSIKKGDRKITVNARRFVQKEFEAGKIKKKMLELMESVA